VSVINAKSVPTTISVRNVILLVSMQRRNMVGNKSIVQLVLPGLVVEEETHVIPPHSREEDAHLNNHKGKLSILLPVMFASNKSKVFVTSVRCVPTMTNAKSATVRKRPTKLTTNLTPSTRSLDHASVAEVSG